MDSEPRGRLRRAGVLAAACALCGGVGLATARGQLRVWDIPKPRNGPGLRCWGGRIGLNPPILVYAEPLPGARVLGVTHAMVAATGAPADGFVPVITGIGARGYVLERDVAQDRWLGLACFVRRDPVTGHLAFTYTAKAPP